MLESIRVKLVQIKWKQEQKPFINYMYINVSGTYFKVDLNGYKKKNTINIVANVQIFKAQKEKKEEFRSVKTFKT